MCRNRNTIQNQEKIELYTGDPYWLPLFIIVEIFYERVKYHYRYEGVKSILNRIVCRV